MIPFTTTNFLIYFFIAWGTNIALNFLYVIKRYVPIFSNLDYPIDFKLTYKKSRLLGDSTTIIGLLLCLSISIVLYNDNNHIWATIPIIIYMGHLIGSFIKRRMKKNGGEFVPVIDHGDYMLLLGIIFTTLNYVSLIFSMSALLLTYLLHPIVCFIAFKLKLRERPY